MKLKFASAAAAVALAAAAAVAVPTAAQAATTGPGYGSNQNCTISPVTISPGSIFIFICPGGTFDGNVSITITLEGSGVGGSSQAFLKPQASDVATLSAQSGGDGSLNTSIRLADSASGSFRVQAAQSNNPTRFGTASGSVAVNGAPADGGVGAAPGSSSGRDLAATGVDSQELLGLWVGGGALALVGGGLVAATAIRRNRKLASHN